jgi:hypothetical protein
MTKPEGNSFAGLQLSIYERKLIWANSSVPAGQFSLRAEPAVVQGDSE